MNQWEVRVDGRMTRGQMIDALQPRCYFFSEGSKAFRIVKVLNTEFVVAARDLTGSSRREEWLAQKIKIAIQQPVGGEDLQVLNQISALRPPEHHFKDFLAWGLYLYLGGLVTVYPNNSRQDGGSMTFLEACRSAGFLNYKDLRSDEDKFKEALQLLGLWDLKTKLGSFYIRDLMEAWKAKGTFHVLGLSEDNSPRYIAKENGRSFESSGVYLPLVKMLCEPDSPIMRTDNCISFLLQVKREVESLLTAREREEAMLRIVDAASKSSVIAMRYVEQGDKIRFERNLEAAMNAFSVEEIAELAPEQIRYSRAYFERFLNGLPDSTLRTLLYTNQSIAHTEAADISGMIPNGASLAIRRSQGLYDIKYRVLYAAAGLHLLEEGDKQKHDLKRASSSIHETLHMAFGQDGANSFGTDFDDLKNEVRKLGRYCYEVAYKLQRLNPEILQKKSPLLNEPYINILDPQSPFYSDYGHNYTIKGWIWPVQEEILANILSVIFTEQGNPFVPGEKPQPELADLYVLTAELQALYEKISERVETRAIEAAKKVNQVGS